MKTIVILLAAALVGLTSAAPKPGCVKCEIRKGYSAPISSSYISSYPSYAPSVSYASYEPSVHYDSYAPSVHYDSYTPSVHHDSYAPSVHYDSYTPSVHHDSYTPSVHYDSYAPSTSYSAPSYTYSAPSVVHETVSTPVVHETVAAPVVHETTPIVHRQPHVISTWTTQSVGEPQYIPEKTTIHKTTHTKWNVKVPYEYNYEIERPVTHTTSYVNYKPAINSHVVTAPATSYYAPSSSYYAPSHSYSTSYVAPSTSYSTGYVPSTSYSTGYVPSTSYSTNYVSAPATTVVSAPVANSLHSHGTPSSYYSKDYTKLHSYEHLAENYGNNSW